MQQGKAIEKLYKVEWVSAEDSAEMEVTMYLLPQPDKVKMQEGQFGLHYNTRIIMDTGIPEKMVSDVYEYAKLLQREIKADTGFTFAISREKKNPDEENIILTCSEEKDGAKEADREAYLLKICDTGVAIEGKTAAGILYGVQTLRQIIRQEGAVLPCVEIEDAPKILRRGLSYDVTRGRVPSLEELKRQVDVCSFYKINELQLYVEHSYLFRDFSEVWRNNTPLTAEDILELDGYCRKWNIDLVPSLASFGHLYEVLSTKTYAHLCELEHSDEEAHSLIGRMQHHTVDVSKEESFAMAASRIEEFMGLFSSRYFNVCADETFDLCKGRSKALGEERGVKRVYLDFLKRLCGLVISKGKIPMFWGDVLLECPELLKELPKEAVCLNWEYAPDVTEDQVKLLTDAGVSNLYLCPGVQSWNHLINKHSDAYRNISGMCKNAHKYHVKGVLNTEWGDLGHIAHPEFSTIGQIYGAAFSWSDVPMEEETINCAISVLQYGDDTGEVAALFRDLADTECVNWWYAVQYKESMLSDSEEWNPDQMMDIERAEERLQQNEELLKKLYKKLGQLPESRRADVCAYIIMGEGQRLLTITVKTLCDFHEGRSLSYDAQGLAVQLEYWLMEYKKLWRSVSKESELYCIVEIFSWYADRLREML